MRNLLLSLLFAVMPTTALAQVSLTTAGQATVVDFTGFTGAGFAPNPSAGQLDSDDWRITGLSDGDTTFGGTYTTGDYARGSSAGGVSTAGTYAFEANGTGNPALGVQPGGADFTPGTATLRAQNNTGSTVTSIDFSVRRCFLNNEGRSSTLGLDYSTDDVTYQQVGTIVPASTPTTATSNATWVCLQVSSTITGLTLANGALIYFRFSSDDDAGSGSRDEVAVDDISITPIVGTASDSGVDAADAGSDTNSADSGADTAANDAGTDIVIGDAAGDSAPSADSTVDSGPSGDTSSDSLVGDSTVDSGGSRDSTSSSDGGGGSGDDGGCCRVAHDSDMPGGSTIVLCLLLLGLLLRRRRRDRA